MCRSRICRADQRGRDFQRHPLGRHLGRHCPAHRLHRQRRGAAAILAEHPGPVQFCHPLGDSGWRVRQRTAAAVRAFQRKYGLTVDGVVGQTTWKELYDEFLSIQSDNGTPNATPAPPAGGFQRPERAAGTVLAQDRPHRVHQPCQRDGRREIRRWHGSGCAAVPAVFRADGRRGSGAHHMAKAVRGVQ